MGLFEPTCRIDHEGVLAFELDHSKFVTVKVGVVALAKPLT